MVDEEKPKMDMALAVSMMIPEGPSGAKPMVASEAEASCSPRANLGSMFSESKQNVKPFFLSHISPF